MSNFTHPTDTYAGVYRLENGLTVLIKEDSRFPLVVTSLFVHAGSAYERPEEAGISHLLEHMAFKGSLKRGPGKLAEDIEKAGGRINAATSFDYTVYYAELPAARLELGLDALRDATFNLKIDPDELEREKKVVLSEIDKGEDEPGRVLFKTVQQSVWKGTPYDHPVIGYRKTVEKFKAGDINDYVARLYQPQSAMVSVVGGIGEAEALALVKKYFGDLRNTGIVQPPLPFAPKADTAAGATLVRQGNWNKVYFMAALPIPEMASAAAPPLDVLARILGGDANSLFYRKYKYEKKLVEAIGVSAMNMERSGLLMISAQLAPDKVAEFRKTLEEDLASLKAEQIADEQIARAILNIEDGFYQAKETLSGLNTKLSHFIFFEGRQDAEADYLYQLRNTDRATLGKLIADYIGKSRLHSCYLVPENSGLEATLQDKPVAKVKGKPAGGAKTQASEKSGKATDEIEISSIGKTGKLILIPDRTLPYVGLSIVFNGGDSLLDAKEQGFSALTAASLTRGTKNKSFPMIQEFLADRASRLSASTDKDTFVVEAKYPARFEKDILELVLEIIETPAFDREEVQRARLDQAAEIKRREDQPVGLGFRRLFPFIFSSGTYAYNHLGTPEEIAVFTPEHATKIWERQRKADFVLSICGDFDTRLVKVLAQKLAKKTGHADRKSPPPVWAPAGTLDVRLDKRSQAHVIKVYPLPPLGGDDAAALQLLRNILSGQGGMLFGDMRDDKALAYSVSAFLWQGTKAGFMAFYVGTFPDRINDALAGFVDAGKKVASAPVSPEALERAKNLTLGDYHWGRQSLSARSREAGRYLIRSLPYDFEKNMVEKAQKLTSEDILRVAKKYLVEDKAYILKIIP